MVAIGNALVGFLVDVDCKMAERKKRQNSF